MASETYKITIEEDIKFKLADDYELLSSPDGEGLLRKKLSPDQYFRQGDFYAFDNAKEGTSIGIFSNFEDWMHLNFHPYCYINGSNIFFLPKPEDYFSVKNMRHASDEEIQRLKTRLTIERYQWNSNDKILVKLSNEPYIGESYYYIHFGIINASIKQKVNQGEEIDKDNIKEKNYFFDIDIAREAVQKTNTVLNTYKNKKK